MSAQVVERAIAWALEQEGSRTYALRCLSFVEDAYEIPNGLEIFGGSTAKESCDLYEAPERSGEPPRGAFVFFDTAGLVDGVRRAWGHVGLALGDGRIVHTWPEVRVDALTEIPHLSRGSWSTPEYVGWAPVEVILRGSTARSPERP